MRRANGTMYNGGMIPNCWACRPLRAKQNPRAIPVCLRCHWARGRSSPPTRRVCPCGPLARDGVVERRAAGLSGGQRKWRREGVRTHPQQHDDGVDDEQQRDGHRHHRELPAQQCRRGEHVERVEHHAEANGDLQPAGRRRQDGSPPGHPLHPLPLLFRGNHPVCRTETSDENTTRAHQRVDFLAERQRLEEAPAQRLPVDLLRGALDLQLLPDQRPGARLFALEVLWPQLRGRVLVRVHAVEGVQPAQQHLHARGPATCQACHAPSCVRERAAAGCASQRTRRHATECDHGSPPTAEARAISLSLDDDAHRQHDHCQAEISREHRAPQHLVPLLAVRGATAAPKLCSTAQQPLLCFCIGASAGKDEAGGGQAGATRRDACEGGRRSGGSDEQLVVRVQGSQ